MEKTERVEKPHYSFKDILMCLGQEKRKKSHDLLVDSLITSGLPKPIIKEVKSPAPNTPELISFFQEEGPARTMLTCDYDSIRLTISFKDYHATMEYYFTKEDNSINSCYHQYSDLPKKVQLTDKDGYPYEVDFEEIIIHELTTQKLIQPKKIHYAIEKVIEDNIDYVNTVLLKEEGKQRTRKEENK